MAEQDVWATVSEPLTAERWHPAAAQWGTALTQALLDSADLHENCHVLDVAAGSGDPALSIAKRLADGKVTAIDTSRPGLLRAKRQGDLAGLGSRLNFVQTDVHKVPFLDSSFDRVTCRLGIMFFADVDRALAQLWRVLRPGGRASFLAWGPFEQPLFASTAGAILRLVSGTSIPEPARAPFKFATPGSLEDALGRARFRNVQERHMTLPRIWAGSPRELWGYFQEVNALFHPLIHAIPEEMGTSVEEAVRLGLARYQSGQTITVPAQVVLATAER
jgi:SAM-dependent methyltransferase